MEEVPTKTNPAFFKGASFGKAQNNTRHQKITYRAPAMELLKNSWPGPW